MSQVQTCNVNSAYEHALREAIPLNVLFELTYRCNLQCCHCYVAASHDGVELRFSEITGILEQLAGAGCLFLTFTGGEVLVRRDFLDIMRYARRLGFALKVFTNATLLDDHTAHEMASLKPLQVGVSIYGADAATHDRITGMPGSFEHSVSALRRLHGLGVTTMLKCVLMKENFAQMGRITGLAYELGAIPQMDPVLSPRNDGDQSPLQHEIGDSELYQFLSQVVETKDEGEARPLTEHIICRAGRDVCCISPDGEVRPCVAMPMALGSLRRHSFVDIWHGAEARKLRSLMLSDLRQCVPCGDLRYCTRCWGLAGVESGDYLGPSKLNCRVARIRHRIAAERSMSKERREK